MNDEIEKRIADVALESMGIYCAGTIKNGVHTPRDDFGNGWNDYRCERNKTTSEHSQLWHEVLRLANKNLKEDAPT